MLREQMPSGLHTLYLVRFPDTYSEHPAGYTSGTQMVHTTTEPHPRVWPVLLGRGYNSPCYKNTRGANTHQFSEQQQYISCEHYRRANPPGTKEIQPMRIFCQKGIYFSWKIVALRQSIDDISLQFERVKGVFRILSSIVVQ